MVECPACGAENRLKARFCMTCGRSLTPFETGGLKQPSTLETLEKGTILGSRFEVSELLNIGGMGYVYRGIDTLLQREVAVKEMIDKFTDPEARTQAIERFRREADMLCHLKHPAIPTFFEYFVENQRYYLVMDLVDGLDLKKIVKRLQGANKEIPLERVVQWALEICEVLEYLHSHKPPVVYRDLKPSNIMITPTGNVKLIDFGIARLFISQLKATMVGTQGYAPPEQYRGEAEPRSDLYALGATLHHLFTGKDPQYEAPFHFELIRKLNPSIPVSLEMIIEKALHLIPDDRFQSAGDFKSALTDMITQEEQFSDLHREIESIEQEISTLKQRKTRILNADIRKAMSGDETEKMDIPTPEKRREWNLFRGNVRRTGLSIVPTHLKGNMKWRLQIGRKITASPVVDENENIYIGTYENSFYCLQENSEIRWIFKTRGVISATAAVDKKGNTYIPCEDGTMYAVDSTGVEKWRFTTRDSLKASPLLVRDRLFIGSLDGNFYCVGIDGKHIWHFNSEAPISSSAALAYDGTIIFGNHGGMVYAIKPDGEMRWKVELPRLISATPAISPEGQIYIGCEDGYLYSLSLFGKILWKFKTGGWIRSSVAIGKNATIYIGSSDHYLYAVDREGVEKWRYDSEGVIISSPAISDDGGIYFASDEGILFAIQPWGKVKWWFSLDGKVYSSPALGPDGTLFIGSDAGYIFAIK